MDVVGYFGLYSDLICCGFFLSVALQTMALNVGRLTTIRRNRSAILDGHYQRFLLLTVNVRIAFGQKYTGCSCCRQSRIDYACRIFFIILKVGEFNLSLLLASLMSGMICNFGPF